MNIRAVILCSALLLTAPLFAREKTDVIVMKNGDRLTCQVKELDAGVLYVSLDYVLGTISVQWSEVAHLESNQLFIVQTEDGSVYEGTLSTVETPDGRPVKIQVAESPEEKVVIDGPQIVRMDETSKKFWQRFNGSLNSGTTYSKGNQSTQYNLSAQVEYKREGWGGQASFNSTLSASTGATTSTRNQIALGSQRRLRWKNYFYFGRGGFLQSVEQGIDLLASLSGGIGHYLKDNNAARIALLGGLTVQRTYYERSVVPLDPQNILAALIGADLYLFKFDKTNLSVSATLLPALSEPGRVFFGTNAAYYIKLFGNLSWNISFYGNWDNRPPAGLSGSDYGASSGVGYTFGNN